MKENSRACVYFPQSKIVVQQISEKQRKTTKTTLTPSTSFQWSNPHPFQRLPMKNNQHELVLFTATLWFGNWIV